MHLLISILPIIMRTDMSHSMQVQRSVVNGELQYDLTLSRENFNHLSAGCPEVDRLVGSADNGVMFYIFNDLIGNMPYSFKLMPGGEGYYAYIGAPVPRIPQGVTSDEFEELAQQAYRNLETGINESGRIPIQLESRWGEINCGHVVINVVADNVEALTS